MAEPSQNYPSITYATVTKTRKSPQPYHTRITGNAAAVRIENLQRVSVVIEVRATKGHIFETQCNHEKRQCEPHQLKICGSICGNDKALQ